MSCTPHEGAVKVSITAPDKDSGSIFIVTVEIAHGGVNATALAELAKTTTIDLLTKAKGTK